MPYLSRVCLRQDASVSALAPLLLGQAHNESKTRHPAHHLIWSLFADHADRSRDFLWREMRTGVFLVLSDRHPVDRHGLFDIDKPKLFNPNLESGDRLKFSLRANPVVRRRHEKRRRSTKHDVVMDALRSLPASKRPLRRLEVMRSAGIEWLVQMGNKAGFNLSESDVWVDGYTQHSVARKGTAPTMKYSTLDFEGTLTVQEPPVLVSRIAQGFGSAKAYGCGLLLIRRSAR
ncbi:MAG: type I-E CRISPR-associated protein Cas6/Cse3/CasE [Gammaproteobacteria bacterium]|nr:type I-E CRISPR-associated protein Cas6/Cse3/CasE [Gammaproteobacteria bacterium]MDE2655259.1 type I-E CRISPR-associated protein Cas6/Cse3/CasE [Gemmatimonadota bacterium]